MINNDSSCLPQQKGNADYEIIPGYGRKYLIFSNGDDIEVLNY